MAVCAFFSIVSISCTKICNCNTVVTSHYTNPDWEGMDQGGNINQTVETQGKCSDLSATSTQTLSGYTLESVTTCR